MKKQISFAVITVVLFAALVNLASCEKDSGKLPNISFKTGAGYVSKDTTLAAGTAFTVGISATKAETQDVLKTFNITKAIGTAAATNVQSITLTSAQGDSYSQDFPFTAGTTGTTETYTFTVSNRDGLVNSVTVKITVN